MKRRNLLKAACAALLAPLYAVVGKAEPKPKLTSDPMRCFVCDGTDDLQVAYPFKPKDKGGYGWIVFGYRDYTNDACRICKKCRPKGTPVPLPWERYFAKHNIKWSGDVRKYSAVRNDPEWEEVFAVRLPMRDEHGFWTMLRHRVTGLVTREEISFRQTWKDGKQVFNHFHLWIVDYRADVRMNAAQMQDERKQWDRDLRWEFI